jgi:hypothetical protein
VEGLGAAIAAGPLIGGEKFTPFGFSVVPFLILAGFGCLAGFASWEERRERKGQDTPLDRSLLRIEHLRGGLTTLLMQQLILLGIFFVLPVYSRSAPRRRSRAATRRPGGAAVADHRDRDPAGDDRR